jgi:hypothetical protein
MLHADTWLELKFDRRYMLAAGVGVYAGVLAVYVMRLDTCDCTAPSPIAGTR